MVTSSHIESREMCAAKSSRIYELVKMDEFMPVLVLQEDHDQHL